MKSTASTRAKVPRSIKAGWLRPLTHFFFGIVAAAAATSAMATIAVGTPQSRGQIGIYVGTNFVGPAGNTASCTMLTVPVTNIGGGAPADVWVTLELPDPSNLTTGQYPSAPFHLGEVPVDAGNGTIPPAIAYFYLCAKDGTTEKSVGNQVTLKAWDVDPVAYPPSPTDLLDELVLSGATGLEVNLGDVKANSNKIETVTFSPSTSTYVGGIVTMTETGQTGTLGADERFVLSPSVFKTLRTDLFQLRKAELTITGGGVLPLDCRDETDDPKKTTNFLSCTFVPGQDVTWNGKEGAFTIVYTFSVVGSDDGTFPITPLNYIDSGENLKYSPPTTFYFPAITTLLTAVKTANPTSFQQIPSSTDPFTTIYQLVVSSTANEPTEFSDWIDTLPAGVTYVADSAQLSSSDGGQCGISPLYQPIGDPDVTGSTLRWSRRFTVPASGTCTLTFDASIPNTAATYENCAIVKQFDISIEAGCADVIVSPPPTPGTLTIIKNTTGGNGTFNFALTQDTSTVASPQIVTSGGTGQVAIQDLQPGTYALAETVLTGWDLSSASCTNGTPSAFVLADGGNVTCTFSNTARASITIKKQTSPSADTKKFAFTTTGLPDPASFSLANGELQQYSNLVPGRTYTAAETAASGYRLASVQCVVSGGSATASYPANGFSITPTPGSATVCTFTNLKNASVEIRKSLTLPPGVTLASGQNSFGFTLTCAGVATPYKATVTLPSETTGTLSGSAEINPVEASRSCTLTETKPTAPKDWQWGAEIIAAPTQTTQPGAVTTFNVTNVLATTVTGEPTATPIPTLGPLAMWLLGLLLAGLGAVFIHRRH